MSRGWIRIFTFRCPEVGSFIVSCPEVCCCCRVCRACCVLARCAADGSQYRSVCPWFVVAFRGSVRHPSLDSFSFSGLCRRTSFLVKTIAENQWCCFRFSAIVLSSSALAKNRSELNGCRKTITFEKPLCLHASPESPLDARK